MAHHQRISHAASWVSGVCQAQHCAQCFALSCAHPCHQTVGHVGRSGLSEHEPHWSALVDADGTRERPYA